MKHNYLTFIALCLAGWLALTTNTAVQAAHPQNNRADIMATCPADSFGYTCVDSNEPNGPAFNWIDISGTGTNMNLVDDSHFFPIDLPFNFDFYGTTYNQVAVGSNGTVYFQNNYLTLSNQPIPAPNSSGIATLIAVYWDDLNPSASGAVYYEIRGTAPQRYLVVQFDGVPNFGTTDLVTAQAILYEGTNNILMQYLDPSNEAGGGATTGIQGNITTGLQYSYNTATLSANLAVCYQHPTAITSCDSSVIWDGGGVDNNWSTAENWLGDQLPSSTDTVIFDSTSSKDALVDGAFAGTVAGLAISADYNGTITQAVPLTISGDYDQRGGTVIVDGTTPFTVGNSFAHTGGTLQQTQVVNNAAVSFLQIEDGAATVLYRGVDLDTSSNGNDLGAVTVRIRRVDGVSSFCTQDGGSSPTYALRCFEITPTNNLPADMLRLYADTAAELNGIAQIDLQLFHWNDVTKLWVPQSSNAGTGNLGTYSYAEASVSSFSPFLLGGANDPTAVTNLQTDATPAAGQGWLVGLLVGLLGAATAVFLRLRRHS